jgi:hypothetical protein
MNSVKVIGVHPMEADEPVHLIELEVKGPTAFDFDQVTQKVVDQPKDNWQVPYDERELDKNGARRFASFFHYLDFDAPLETPFGPIDLPAPSPIPDYLKQIRYEEP